jgi:transposase
MQKIVTVFVGLDYHSESVQVCVMDAKGRIRTNRSLANESRVINQFVSRYGGRVVAAIEACSGAAHLAEELITQAGWEVNLAHPGFVARMKQNPDKTDYTDARLLADLERVGYLPRVWLATKEVRELRRVVRYRKQLVDERRNRKLRIRALLRDGRVKAPSGCRAWTIAWREWLKQTAALSDQSRWILERHLKRLEQLQQEILEVEKRLCEMVGNDAVVAKLLTYAGIGLITAVTLRAEIGRFDRFGTSKQLARFTGLSPRNASSGERQADAGLIKAGNPYLRSVLIEAAHRLSRFDPRWRALAHSLAKRGKPTNVIVAAVANRWVRWLFHQMQPEQFLTAA